MYTYWLVLYSIRRSPEEAAGAAVNLPPWETKATVATEVTRLASWVVVFTGLPQRFQQPLRMNRMHGRQVGFIEGQQERFPVKVQ